MKLEQSMHLDTINKIGTMSPPTRCWMSVVPDDQPLNKMSIPGTHESCALVNYAYAKCQNDSITAQLENGIRYLDIRCRVSGDVFTIHHDSVYEKINFGDVLNECLNFFSRNPSETILMRIKQEYSSESDSTFINIFNSHYSYYHQFMYLKYEVPNLGDVRGKIVVISNVSGLPGIQWDGMAIQDDYGTTGNDKWKLVSDHIYRSVDNCCKNPSSRTLFLNHLSYVPKFLYTMSDDARFMGNKLYDFLMDGLIDFYDRDTICRNYYLGILPMNYVDLVPFAIQQIIKFNRNKYFIDQPVYEIYNTVYGKQYLYASSIRDGDRRHINTWLPGNPVKQGYWLVLPLGNTNEFAFYNTMYKEYLYAVYDGAIVDNRRPSRCWGPGILDETGVWQVTSSGDARFIYNVLYKAYLYESSIHEDSTRAQVPSWAPGNLVNQAYWHFDFVEYFS